jgi:hypothetical protein
MTHKAIAGAKKRSQFAEAVYGSVEVDKPI